MSANGGADVACAVAGPDGAVSVAVAVLPLLVDEELLLLLLPHPAAKPSAASPMRAANATARPGCHPCRMQKNMA